MANTLTIADAAKQQALTNPWVSHSTGYKSTSGASTAAKQALAAPQTGTGAYDPLSNQTVAGAAQAALGGLQKNTTTVPVMGGYGNGAYGPIGQAVQTTTKSPITGATLMQVGMADYQAKMQAQEYLRNTLVPEAKTILQGLQETVPANIQAGAKASSDRMTAQIAEGRANAAASGSVIQGDAEGIRQRVDQMRQEALTTTENWAERTLSNFKNTFALETGQRIQGMRTAADQQLQRLNDMANSGAGGMSAGSLETAKRLINGQLSDSLSQQNASVGIEWNNMNAQLHSQMTNIVSNAQQATASMVEKGYEAAGGLTAQWANIGAELEKTAINARAMNEQGQISAVLAAEQARLSVGEEIANLILSDANQPWAGELLPLFTGMASVFASEISGQMQSMTAPLGPAAGSQGLTGKVTQPKTTAGGFGTGSAKTAGVGTGSAAAATGTTGWNLGTNW